MDIIYSKCYNGVIMVGGFADETICRKIVHCSDSAYSAYCNMHNMQNMSNNMLQYAQQYAKYAKQYAEK